MNYREISLVEQLQQAVAEVIATNPAGHNLLLIGGFRYRFLDHSVRVSDDIDYHWCGDLVSKQRDLIRLFERRLLPDIRMRFKLEGRVDARRGPDADSPAVKAIDLAFWGNGISTGRIEIPVEITRIVCADKVELRTASGIIYPTVSNADMIESKILAVFSRNYLRHRDLLDIYLFKDNLHSESSMRLTRKMAGLQLTKRDVSSRLKDLRQNSFYHARAVQEVIDTQLDGVAAAHLRNAGGGATVLREALVVISAALPMGDVDAGD